MFCEVLLPSYFKYISFILFYKTIGRGTDPDAFRQRRQNTSRPPSMHVDDFVSMEKKGDTLMAHSKTEANCRFCFCFA